MKRLALVIPFYDADREQAMRMAKFICDLEPKYRDDVFLCFVNRWDCPPIHPAEMMRFITTFRVEWFASTTKAEGHPAGPNAMAKDIFLEAQRLVDAQRWADVDALLLMEPDCVPVAKDWLDQLRAEWDRAQDTNKAVSVGCWRDRYVDVPHVNGNALWSTRLATAINVNMDCHGFGWDSAFSEQLRHRIYPTAMIVNLWREENVADSRFEKSPFLPQSAYRPVLAHGVKDDSARKYAEKMTGVKFK